MKKQKAYLIYKNETTNQYIKISVNPEADGDEFVEYAVKPMMLAISYHINTVNKSLGLED